MATVSFELSSLPKSTLSLGFDCLLQALKNSIIEISKMKFEFIFLKLRFNFLKLDFIFLKLDFNLMES
jgi:hypothetical protein